MSLDTWTRSRADRCSGCGYHAATQGCRCASDDWTIFRAALTAAARTDGRVHQSDVRPRIRGRIEPKHIGLQYKRAIREGLLREVDAERSDDEHGKNAGRWEPVYELRSAA